MGQHLHRSGVLAAVGHNDVCVALAGLYKGLVHGLDGGQVLIDDAVQTAAPLLHIPHQTAQDALVGVGVHIDLVVEQGAQLRLHKGQDAFHDQHRCGLDVLHLVAAVVVGVVVHRAVDGAACLQLLQMVDQQSVVKSIRMVVVQLAALLKRQLVVALVIAVVGDQAHFILAKTLLQPQSKGGLAAAGAACNANDQIIHRGPSCIILPLWVEKRAGMDYNRCKAACPGHSAGRACSCTS